MVIRHGAAGGTSAAWSATVAHLDDLTVGAVHLRTADRHPVGERGGLQMDWRRPPGATCRRRVASVRSSKTEVGTPPENAKARW